MKISALTALGALAGAAAVAGPAAGAAAAATRPADAAPTASLSVARAMITAGSTDTFSYKAAHLPSGAAGALQERFGISWKAVATLGDQSGTVVLPLATIRDDTFRVLYTLDSRTVAVSPHVDVDVLATPVVAVKGLTAHVSAGQSPTFKYTLENLATGERAELQRQFGAGGPWRNVAPLHVTKLGTVAAPALGKLGKYAYRAVVTSGGSTVKTSAEAFAYSYVNVPLTPVCTGACTGTVQVGKDKFRYTGVAYGATYPSYQGNAEFGGTTCRSIHVLFAGDADAQAQGDTAYLEFAQRLTDARYTSVASGQVGVVTVPLDGSQLHIGAATTTGYNVDLSITGSCYTASGRP